MTTRRGGVPPREGRGDGSMRFISTIVVAFILAGCTAQNVRQAAIVDPIAIQSYAAICSAEVSGLSPQGYVYAGMDFVDQQCTTFFDNVILLQKDARYASSSVATANTQTALILAAVEASAKSIAIVAASSELIRRLIDGFASEYAFAPYAVEVRKLVFDTLTAYRMSPETDDAIAALRTANTMSDAQCIATNIVRNYAKICSISGVEALARQAISNSPVSKSDGSGGFAPASFRVTQRLAVRRTVRRATAAEVETFRRGLPLPNFVAGAPR